MWMNNVWQVSARSYAILRRMWIKNRKLRLAADVLNPYFWKLKAHCSTASYAQWKDAPDP
ncbi:MAG: hypothetical protein COZ43_05305 [Sphingomonadales bacterium CG_4_10_14_3_um_filter_58_15]|nr:MAG: hypothetical protein COZ43_05305 [Sphingomonadales bacterium CG_4_10_14_3_um_filter_58_15]